MAPASHSTLTRKRAQQRQYMTPRSTPDTTDAHSTTLSNARMQSRIGVGTVWDGVNVHRVRRSALRFSCDVSGKCAWGGAATARARRPRQVDNRTCLSWGNPPRSTPSPAVSMALPPCVFLRFRKAPKFPRHAMSKKRSRVGQQLFIGVEHG